MGDELRRRFTRARLAAILKHELRESGNVAARSDVAIVPRMGYLVSIDNGESLTVRIVDEEMP
jgi:hypothetical protein